MFLQKVFRDFREVIQCAECAVNATKPLHTYYLPLQLCSRNTLKDTIPLKLFLYQHSNIKFVYKPRHSLPGYCCPQSTRDNRCHVPYG